MRVWITKHALTQGVYSAEVDLISGTMVKRLDGLNRGFAQYFHGGDWHTSQSAAIDKADDMRDAKIKSLKKQLAMLENLEFKAVRTE